MDNRPIGVFDSGLGGLTSVRELRRLLPRRGTLSISGDTGRVPYGSRSREIILQYARQDIAFLLSQNVKCIVAACGTVSSTYPSEEAAKLPVPYMGVVSSAGAAGRPGHPQPQDRGDRHLRHHPLPQLRADPPAPGARGRDHRPGLPPVRLPGGERLCGRLRPRLPAGDPAVIAQYLQEVREAGVDTLILGLHPLPPAAGMIGEYMGPAVTLIDPGRAAADDLDQLLAGKGLRASRERGGTRFYVSDVPDSFIHTADLFLGEYRGGTAEQICIDQY